MSTEWVVTTDPGGPFCICPECLSPVLPGEGTGSGRHRVCERAVVAFWEAFAVALFPALHEFTGESRRWLRMNHPDVFALLPAEVAA